MGLNISPCSKQWSCQYNYMDAPRGRWLSVWRKSLTVITQECCKLYWTGPGGNTPKNNSFTVTKHPSWKLSKLEEAKKGTTAREVRINSYVMYSCGSLHMKEQRRDDLWEPIYRSSVLIRGVDWKSCRIGWLVGCICRYLRPNPFSCKQFYFKQFSLAWIHSLIVKNIYISSYSVYSNSSNSV